MRRTFRILSSPTLSFVVLLALSLSSSVQAQILVAHWVNDLGQMAVPTINSGAAFVTNFKGSNDLTVRILNGQVSSIYTDNNGGNSPTNNNPDYLKTFVGSPASGTGSGQVGTLWTLESTEYGNAARSAVEFDFALPLTPEDRFLIYDVDGNEQYAIQAFQRQGNNYTPLATSGWQAESFSGETGILPDSRWPIWDGTTGIIGTSADVGNLDEPLTILTPDQSVDRIVLRKITGSGTPDLQFVSFVPEPGIITFITSSFCVLSIRTFLRRRRAHSCP